jgi:multidrug transporter EmrE-like cation transporter
LLGIGLVVLGALMLHARPQALVRERGSLYMALVALLWSVSPAVDKLALGYATPVVHAAVQVAGVATVMLLTLALRGGLARLGTVRAAPSVVVAAVFVGALALATQLLALAAVMVSAFEAVKRGIGMSLSVVSGRLWFGEPVTIAKLCAITTMGLGIALVAWG